MFAKIEDGKIVFPPRVLKGVELTFVDENGNPVVGIYDVGYDPAKEPEPEVVAYLLANGYLPVVESQRPEDGDGYYYVAGYEPDGDHIAQVWERREMEPEPPSIEDALYKLAGGI